jgi:probable HAF family extracellular repeat protein
MPFSTVPMQPPRHHAIPAWAMAGCLAGLLTAGQAQAASAVDLGVLNGGPYSSGRAINNKGQTIGNALDGVTLSYHQVLWNRTTISDWSSCCGSGLGVPKAINLSREAAGYNEGGFDTYPVYWSSTGATIELPGLPGGNGRGAASDINNAGTVAGHTRAPDGLSRRAVLWQRGVLVRDLGFMGEASPGVTNHSMAYGINSAGVVVGASIVGTEFHAFRWHDGSFTDLGPGTALDVTDDGTTIFGNAPGLIPVLWRNGVRENLPALGGGTTAYGHTAMAMNNLGDVVGYAPARKAPYLDTAVLWRGGKAIDLRRYPGGTVSRAFGVNDKGQIVGEGNLAPDGPMHALRWTVKPGQAPVVERH